MSDHIHAEKRGHILSIEVRRPEKRNALTWEMARALNAAYTRLADDEDLRCGVVHAQGPHFTGGLDLMDVAPRLAGTRVALLTCGQWLAGKSNTALEEHTDGRGTTRGA